MSALTGGRFGPLSRNDPWLEPADARRARLRRIYLAMLAIGLMAAADLIFTLTYMRTSGMIEANPLARFMIFIGDAPQLIMFKIFTTALSCGALYLAREHRRAEPAAWVCAAMLLALIVHWNNYNTAVSRFTNDLAILAMTNGADEPRWVKLE